MKTTRRTFLQTTTLLAASLPFARLPLAGAEPASPAAPAGPRRGLFFDESDLPRIRANTTDPRFADYWQSLVTADLADDTDFIEHKVRFNNHVADMARVRQILERSSFVYAVNHDAKHLAVAKLAARKLLDYPKWDYFLEGGKQVFGLQRAPEATIAMCCALDWLGDGISAGERADIEKGIAEKGAPACYTTLYGMKFPDRVKGWGFDPEDDYPQAFRVNLARWPLILNATNLKVIPTAALGIAACALHGKHPQAEQWLDLARSSAKAFSTMFGSDGSYDEGVSYWGYTAMHLRCSPRCCGARAASTIAISSTIPGPSATRSRSRCRPSAPASCHPAARAISPCRRCAPNRKTISSTSATRSPTPMYRSPPGSRARTTIRCPSISSAKSAGQVSVRAHLA